MSAETERAMLAAIRTHVADESGKDAYGAIVILADELLNEHLKGTKS